MPKMAPLHLITHLIILLLLPGTVNTSEDMEKTYNKEYLQQAAKSDDPRDGRLAKALAEGTECRKWAWACNKACRAAIDLKHENDTSVMCTEPLPSDTCFGLPIDYPFVPSRHSMPHELEVLRRFPKCWSVLGPMICGVIYRPCGVHDFVTAAMFNSKRMEVWQRFTVPACERVHELCQDAIAEGFFPSSLLECRQTVKNATWSRQKTDEKSPLHRLVPGGNAEDIEIEWERQTLFTEEACTLPYRENASRHEPHQCLFPLVYTAAHESIPPVIDKCYLPCRNPFVSSPDRFASFRVAKALLCALVGVACAGAFLFLSAYSSTYSSEAVFAVAHAFLAAAAYLLIWGLAATDAWAYSAECANSSAGVAVRAVPGTSSVFEWCVISSFLLNTLLLATIGCVAVAFAASAAPLRKKRDAPSEEEEEADIEGGRRRSRTTAKKVYGEKKQIELARVKPLIAVYCFALAVSAIGVALKMFSSDGLAGVCALGLHSSIGHAGAVAGPGLLLSLAAALYVAHALWKDRKHVEREIKRKTEERIAEAIMQAKAAEKIEFWTDHGPHHKDRLQLVQQPAQQQQPGQGLPPIEECDTPPGTSTAASTAEEELLVLRGDEAEREWISEATKRDIGVAVRREQQEEWAQRQKAEWRASIDRRYTLVAQCVCVAGLVLSLAAHGAFLAGSMQDEYAAARDYVTCVMSKTIVRKDLHWMRVPVHAAEWWNEGRAEADPLVRRQRLAGELSIHGCQFPSSGDGRLLGVLIVFILLPMAPILCLLAAFLSGLFGYGGMPQVLVRRKWSIARRRRRADEDVEMTNLTHCHDEDQSFAPSSMDDRRLLSIMRDSETEPATGSTALSGVSVHSAFVGAGGSSSGQGPMTSVSEVGAPPSSVSLTGGPPARFPSTQGIERPPPELKGPDRMAGAKLRSTSPLPSAAKSVVGEGAVAVANKKRNRSLTPKRFDVFAAAREKRKMARAASAAEARRAKHADGASTDDGGGGRRPPTAAGAGDSRAESGQLAAPRPQRAYFDFTHAQMEPPAELTEAILANSGTIRDRVHCSSSSISERLQAVQEEMLVRALPGGRKQRSTSSSRSSPACQNDGELDEHWLATLEASRQHFEVNMEVQRSDVDSPEGAAARCSPPMTDAQMELNTIGMQLSALAVHFGHCIKHARMEDMMANKNTVHAVLVRLRAIVWLQNNNQEATPELRTDWQQMMEFLEARMRVNQEPGAYERLTLLADHRITEIETPDDWALRERAMRPETRERERNELYEKMNELLATRYLSRIAATGPPRALVVPPRAFAAPRPAPSGPAPIPGTPVYAPMHVVDLSQPPANGGGGPTPSEWSHSQTNSTVPSSSLSTTDGERRRKEMYRRDEERERAALELQMQNGLPGPSWASAAPAAPPAAPSVPFGNAFFASILRNNGRDEQGRFYAPQSDHFPAPASSSQDVRGADDPLSSDNSCDESFERDSDVSGPSSSASRHFHPHDQRSSRSSHQQRRRLQPQPQQQMRELHDRRSDFGDAAPAAAATYSLEQQPGVNGLPPAQPLYATPEAQQAAMRQQYQHTRARLQARPLFGGSARRYDEEEEKEDEEGDEGDGRLRKKKMKFDTPGGSFSGGSNGSAWDRWNGGGGGAGGSGSSPFVGYLHLVPGDVTGQLDLPPILTEAEEAAAAAAAAAASKKDEDEDEEFGSDSGFDSSESVGSGPLLVTAEVVVEEAIPEVDEALTADEPAAEAAASAVPAAAHAEAAAVKEAAVEAAAAGAIEQVVRAATLAADDEQSPASDWEIKVVKMSKSQGETVPLTEEELEKWKAEEREEERSRMRRFLDEEDPMGPAREGESDEEARRRRRRALMDRYPNVSNPDLAEEEEERQQQQRRRAERDREAGERRAVAAARERNRRRQRDAAGADYDEDRPETPSSAASKLTPEEQRDLVIALRAALADRSTDGMSEDMRRLVEHLRLALDVQGGISREEVLRYRVNEISTETVERAAPERQSPYSVSTVIISRLSLAEIGVRVDAIRRAHTGVLYPLEIYYQLHLADVVWPMVGRNVMLGDNVYTHEEIIRVLGQDMPFVQPGHDRDDFHQLMRKRAITAASLIGRDYAARRPENTFTYTPPPLPDMDVYGTFGDPAALRAALAGDLQPIREAIERLPVTMPDVMRLDSRSATTMGSQLRHFRDWLDAQAAAAGFPLRPDSYPNDEAVPAEPEDARPDAPAPPSSRRAPGGDGDRHDDDDGDGGDDDAAPVF